MSIDEGEKQATNPKKTEKSGDTDDLIERASKALANSLLKDPLGTTEKSEDESNADTTNTESSEPKTKRQEKGEKRETE